MLLASGQLERPDYIVLVGYFALMLGVGGYFYRHMRGLKDYFSGGNRLPWWLSGVSFYMSAFSAFTFVAYSELAYKFGFVAVTLYWTTGPAVLLGALFLSARWRRARIISPVEFLEERYGLGIRQAFAWANVPVRMIDDGLRLLAIGLFVSGGVGLPLKTSILISGAVILAYTLMGGLWAVAVTDFLQFIVMTAGIALLVPLALNQVGGCRGFVAGAPAGFFHLTDDSHPWSYVLVLFLLIVLLYNTNFALVQRYYSVRDERAARRAGLLVAALNMVGPPLFFLPAMAARQFLPDVQPDRVYAAVCVHLLPVGTLGLMIAAMFSATMSALSSDYNVVAAVLTNDVYRRLINPRASDRRLVLVGRLTTLLIGAVALGVALLIAGGKGDSTLFEKMIKLFSVAGPPMALPMLAGLLWRWCTNAGAVLGFLAGVAVGLALFFLGYGEHTIILATSGVTLAVMVAASRLIPVGPAEQRRRARFAAKLGSAVEPAREDTQVADGIAPYRIVGVCTLLIGLLMLAILPSVGWGAPFWMNLVIGLVLFLIGTAMAVRRGPLCPPEEDAT